MTLGRKINQALGAEKADLVIKNINILDVVTGQITTSDIAITDQTIVGINASYEGKEKIDGSDLYAAPGFIDSHLHIESSMVTPMEFERCVLPKGTTTAICDPHEMSNVLGTKALEYFLTCSENTVFDLFINLSSCVPATPLETSGAILETEDLAPFIEHKNVIGLAEFMNIGGVLGQAPNVLEKLDMFKDQHIDGHLPDIKGHALNAMLSCGISTCHESTSPEEAIEKLQKGVQVLIREGTVCKDLKSLISIIQPFTSASLAFCTDDRNPLDIEEEGHIDHMIRTAIKGGADMASTYRIASWSAARAFGLDKNTNKWQKRGLIAPGYKADIVLLKDLEQCEVHSVIKNGVRVSDPLFENRKQITPIGLKSIKYKTISETDFQIKKTEEDLPVIGLIKDQIVTKALTEKLSPDSDGFLYANPQKDILKLAVVERHGKNGNIGLGFVKGFGLKEGALASSIGHDSHNITVVGAKDSDMAIAVNRLKDNQGGYVVVHNGEVTAELHLPIAGLMSDKPHAEIAKQLKTLRQAIEKLNPAITEPMMMLAFLPLCVIPELKLTDYGLVRFKPPQDQGPVLIQDQRNCSVA